MRAGASARATRRFFPFSYQTRTARHGGARTDELFDRGGGATSGDEALYLTENAFVATFDTNTNICLPCCLCIRV
jgi:hypothetical protein